MNGSSSSQSVFFFTTINLLLHASVLWEKLNDDWTNVSLKISFLLKALAVSRKLERTVSDHRGSFGNAALFMYLNDTMWHEWSWRKNREKYLKRHGKVHPIRLVFLDWSLRCCCCFPYHLVYPGEFVRCVWDNDMYIPEMTVHDEVSLQSVGTDRIRLWSSRRRVEHRRSNVLEVDRRWRVLLTSCNDNEMVSTSNETFDCSPQLLSTMIARWDRMSWVQVDVRCRENDFDQLSSVFAMSSTRSDLRRRPWQRWWSMWTEWYPSAAVFRTRIYPDAVKRLWGSSAWSTGVSW